MNERSITEKTFEKTLEVQEVVALLHRMIGRAEAFNAMENISRVARLKMLKIIRDNKLYKGIPGCSTMRDVFEKLGVSKTTGYLELEALERLAENIPSLTRLLLDVIVLTLAQAKIWLEVISKPLLIEKKSRFLAHLYNLLGPEVITNGPKKTISHRRAVAETRTVPTRKEAGSRGWTTAL